MSRRTGLSIRWRLTAWITGAFIVTILAIFVALRLVLGQILYDDVNSDLPKQLADVQGQIVFRASTDQQVLENILNARPYPAIIRDTNGKVVAQNDEADPGEGVQGKDPRARAGESLQPASGQVGH